MKWLIVLLMIDGEPSIVSGWKPIQVEAERCEAVAARTSKYISTQLNMANAVACSDAIDQAAIDAAIATMGIGL